jgi:hypothetical protein
MAVILFVRVFDCMSGSHSGILAKRGELKIPKSFSPQNIRIISSSGDTRN